MTEEVEDRRAYITLAVVTLIAALFVYWAIRSTIPIVIIENEATHTSTIVSG